MEKLMPVVTIGGEKGGTGKSTLATNLAVEYARRNENASVALINSDPQNTSGNWNDRRKEEADKRPFLVPIFCCTLMGNSIHKEIKDLARRYDIVIVDGAGRDAAEFRAALLVSDLLITPMRPSIADTETMSTVTSIVSAVHTVNARLRAMWIMNHVRQQSGEARHAQMVEALAGLPALHPMAAIVTNLEAYPDALGFGLGVSELTKRRNRALDEMEAFYHEVKSWL